jgi:putative hemolysin
MESLFPWIATSLAFSFFFSGIEIAFLSANRLQVELQSKQGAWSGQLVAYFLNAPSRFIGTCLVGNTLALVIFGSAMASLFEPALAANLPAALNNDVGILIGQTVISTLIILTTAEFIPKSLFLINPNLMLSTLAIPFAATYVILKPITFTILQLSTLVLNKIFRMN